MKPRWADYLRAPSLQDTLREKRVGANSPIEHR